MYVTKITFPKPFSEDEVAFLERAVESTIREMGEFRIFDNLRSVAYTYHEEEGASLPAFLEIVPEGKRGMPSKELQNRLALLFAQNLRLQTGLVAIVTNRHKLEMEESIGPFEDVNYVISLERDF